MTTPLRTAFFGSPPFATPVLATLVERGHAPVLVGTAPARPAGRGRKEVRSPVVELAESRGIAVRRPETVRDAGLRDELRALELDVILVASYGELLDRAFLAIPRLFCLNVHGSLLPRWRGASPVQAAICAGDTVTGVSVQRVVKKLDAGDVLLSIETPIEPDTTGGALFERLAELGGEAAVRALELVAAGNATFTPQDPALVTHCRKLTKDAGRIDWSRPVAEIERLVRAMEPWPGAATTLPHGDRLVVRRSAVAKPSEAAAALVANDTPGTARALDDDLVVRAGDGALRVLELQAAGKRRMAAGDWLRGARFHSGARLGAAEGGAND